MLGLLIRAGYARRLPRRSGYSLDARVRALARGYRVEDAVVKAAVPVMTSFTARHKWPLAIATRDGHGMRVRETTLGSSPIAAGSDDGYVGRRVGLLLSAVGRAYMAFCAEEERRQLLPAAAALTSNSDTPVSLREAESILDEVARLGHAIGAPIAGDPAFGLAVPIRVAGRAVASLVLRYFGRAISHGEVVQRYLAPLRQAADEIAAAVDSQKD